MKVLVFDDMSQVTEQEVAQMLPLVTAQRCEQALRYKHTLGRFCCLKSWLMVYETGIQGEWEYNEYGKPFVPGAPCFSLSHCKEGIAVAADDQPIGIDIEGIRHADNALIERTMNEAEQAIIRAADEPDRVFTRLWTQKEAVLKCLGTGIEGFEALQQALTSFDGKLTSVEKEHYIYSIATTN